MKKLLLTLLLCVMGTVGAYAESYSIEFSASATSATNLATTTKATTFISSNSQSYVKASPVKSASGAYYGGTGAVEKSSIRFGASKSAGSLTLLLSDNVADYYVNSVVISAKKYAASDSETEFKVNDVSQTISSSDFQEYTFQLSGKQISELSLATVGTSKNRVYVNKITVNYSTSSGPLELGQLSVSANDEAVDLELIIEQGTAISMSAENATSFEVTYGDNTTTLAGPQAQWTPGVCSEMAVSIVAKLEQEGQETQVSDPVEFLLTVNKVDKVTANWVVTGIESITGGSELNKPLICSEESAKGTWTAYKATCYSTTTNGCAQLGSKNNDFVDGTLTLSESDIPENAEILSISLTGYNNKPTIHAVWTIKVGDNTGGEQLTFSNSSATHTANVNLIGNDIVLVCSAKDDSGSSTNIAQTYISGISVTYKIPEPEEEQPGEIMIEHIKHHVLEADDELTIMDVMEGIVLTFTSENAAKMEITTSEEGVTLPEAVEGNSISWTVPEGVFEIAVTASSPRGTKSVSREMVVEGKSITPTTPEFIFEEDSKIVMITCEAGALEYMVEEYTPSTPAHAAMAPVEVTDWTLGDEADPRTLILNFDGLETPKAVSVRSTTPLAKSDIVKFRMNANGQISGVENVAVDAMEGDAVYYDLQGRRVDAPAKGLYIRLQGGKAEKVMM